MSNPNLLDRSETLSITEVSERTGLSQHTLRWYERIGLMLEVMREPSGRRRYTDRDLRWLGLIGRLRATGMPLDVMRRYADLVRQGDSTYSERRTILEEHREHVRQVVKDANASIELLDYKIDHYRSLTCGDIEE